VSVSKDISLLEENSVKKAQFKLGEKLLANQGFNQVFFTKSQQYALALKISIV